MISLENLRKRESEFDFPSYKAAEGRHSIHEYPAMLHYRLVRKLINEYTFKKSKIYDPFCGSGVSIVEAVKLGHSAVGTDINPLALLIADVRASNISSEKIFSALYSLKQMWIEIKPSIPEVKNIDFWFKDYVIQDLGKIRAYIEMITDEEVKKFFLVVFSQTVRNCSNNRKGEFKRYRLPEDKLQKFSPNVLSTFFETANRYIRILSNNPLSKKDIRLFRWDVRKEIPLDEVDFIITSPPYGDSKTTVAYGQFSSFSLEWIRGLNPYGDADIKLDRESLGGSKVNIDPCLPSEYLYKTINLIKAKDEKRAKEVFSFFHDLYLSIKRICNVLNRNATVCFIVGNRTVKGIEIPTDLIVSEFFMSFGLTLQRIFVRKILNKRMPLRNSPSNISGKTFSTMLKEYIVILSK